MKFNPWQPGDSEEGIGMTSEPTHATEEVLRRVQGEFLEMPGLRLTEPQARRLWGLDAASCQALLGALVDAKFLFRTRDGAFMRVEHATPVKAPLRPRSSKNISVSDRPAGWVRVRSSRTLRPIS